jgi:hypothetical protein
MNNTQRHRSRPDSGGQIFKTVQQENKALEGFTPLYPWLTEQEPKLFFFGAPC